ncbi:MAG: hypothetical protein HQL45_08735 [Alphaproteobacteria bacterium]|nr:hypothetical protein [Alphaproteobacteria bacterium]
MAWASEKIDPRQVRLITSTAGTSTCIGNPVSPVCAVETFLACIARNDRELCNRVGVLDINALGRPGGISYKILSVKQIRAADVPKSLGDTEWMKPGNVRVEVLDLSVMFPWCPHGCRSEIFVKPVAQGWHIVDWATEGVD